MGFLSQLTILLATASLGTAAATPVVEQAEAEAAATPRITSITFSGNGCPNNVQTSGSFNDPSFTYKDFKIVVPGTLQTLNCQAHVQASGASAGWQVALKNNWVKGRVSLDAGASLTYYTTVFYSQDASNTVTSQGRLTNTESGKLESNVVLHNEFASKKVWSECIGSDGYLGILNVNFRGAINTDGKASFVAQTGNWDFEWRRC